jgi:hypothetical protein
MAEPHRSAEVTELISRAAAGVTGEIGRIVVLGVEDDVVTTAGATGGAAAVRGESGGTKSASLNSGNRLAVRDREKLDMAQTSPAMPKPTNR